MFSRLYNKYRRDICDGPTMKGERLIYVPLKPQKGYLYKNIP